MLEIIKMIKNLVLVFYTTLTKQRPTRVIGKMDFQTGRALHLTFKAIKLQETLFMG